MSTPALQAWVGRQQTLSDTVVSAPVERLAATLDHGTSSDMGAELPELWHWLYFLPNAGTMELAADGHPKKGGFLPPVALPRRMWAGSQLEFHQPLRIGDPVQRVTTIADVQTKEGRTGPLVFVKLRHDFLVSGESRIVETQDLVFRDHPAPGTPAAPGARADRTADWRRSVAPSPTLLFRYSALTFNAHRIHYDRSYAQREEGYPGLVVHGPLLATLMLDLVRRELPAERVASFAFRALQPLYDTSSLFICGARDSGNVVHLWVENEAAIVASAGTVRFR